VIARRAKLMAILIEGIKSTSPLRQALLDGPGFQAGDYTIK